MINFQIPQIALCKPRNEKVAIKRIDLDKTEFSIEKVIEEVNVSDVVMKEFLSWPDFQLKSRQYSAFAYKTP